MVSVSVALGATSPAEAKAKLDAVLATAKTENEGVIVIDAAESYVAGILASVPASHETSVKVHLFVQVEHSAAPAV